MHVINLPLAVNIYLFSILTTCIITLLILPINLVPTLNFPLFIFFRLGQPLNDFNYLWKNCSDKYTNELECP